MSDENREGRSVECVCCSAQIFIHGGPSVCIACAHARLDASDDGAHADQQRAIGAARALDWDEWSYLAARMDDDCERQSFGAKGQAAMDALHRIKPPYLYAHPKPFPPGMKRKMRVTL